jgi:hypothetical protein
MHSLLHSLVKFSGIVLWMTGLRVATMLSHRYLAECKRKTAPSKCSHWPPNNHGKTNCPQHTAGSICFHTRFGFLIPACTQQLYVGCVTISSIELQATYHCSTRRSQDNYPPQHRIIIRASSNCGSSEAEKLFSRVHHSSLVRLFAY